MRTAPAFVPTAVTPGDLLRRARRQADLTQADLGARLAPPVSHAAISDYERGAVAVDFATLDRLATALGLPLLVEVTLGDIRATVVPRAVLAGRARKAAALIEGDLSLTDLQGFVLADDRRSSVDPHYREG